MYPKHGRSPNGRDIEPSLAYQVSQLLLALSSLDEQASHLV
jgi:hypothetical protein